MILTINGKLVQAEAHCASYEPQIFENKKNMPAGAKNNPRIKSPMAAIFIVDPAP